MLTYLMPRPSSQILWFQDHGIHSRAAWVHVESAKFPPPHSHSPPTKFHYLFSIPPTLHSFLQSFLISWSLLVHRQVGSSKRSGLLTLHLFSPRVPPSRLIRVGTFKLPIRLLLPAPVPPLPTAQLWSSKNPASMNWLCYLHSQGDRTDNDFMVSCKQPSPKPWFLIMGMEEDLGFLRNCSTVQHRVGAPGAVRAAVLNQRRSCSPGNIWQSLETFLIITTWGMSVAGIRWTVPRGCSQASYNAQNSLASKGLSGPTHQ